MQTTRGLQWGRLAVWAAALVFFAVYLWLDLNKLHALRVGSNTGSYLQATLNFLRHGSTFDFGDWQPEMAQHDQWLFLILAPLATIWPRPEMVVAVQVAALAFAAPVLYEAGRRFGASEAAALVVGIAYLLSPSTQGFAYGEFVPLDFVPLLAFALAIAARERSLLWSLVIVQLLAGTKEDVTLFVLWFGLLGVIFYDRRLGVAITALAAVNFCAYEIAERLTRVATVHPQYALYDPEWPKQLAFFAEILAPFAFAPLALGWRIAFAAPLLAELVLAQHWGVPLFQAGEYYSAPLIALVAIASAYGVANQPVFARVMPATALVMALFFNVTVLHVHRHPFSPDPQYGAARMWALTNRTVRFPCEDQGAWVVASPDTNAELLGCESTAHLRRARPAWDDVPLSSNEAWTQGP